MAQRWPLLALDRLPGRDAGLWERQCAHAGTETRPGTSKGGHDELT